MDGEASPAFWLRFFQEAGIPSSEAATYANIFSGNRIRVNMLLDLNKEYLKDMGVTVLGDIIAILKHSKLYHEKMAREKVFRTDEQELSIIKGIKHLKEQQHVSESPKSVAISVTKPVTPQVIKPSPPKKIRTVQPETTHHQEQAGSIEDDPMVERKRKVIAPKVLSIVKSDTNALSGSVKTGKKSSVFQRLGEGNVTSTTPEIPEPSSTTGKSSVFQRLGGMAQEKTEVDKAPTRPILQPVKKKTAIVAPKPTPSSPVVSTLKPPVLRMDVEAASTKQTARARLGVDSQQKVARVTARVAVKNPPATTTKTITSRLSLPARQTQPTGVKQRIGTVKSNVVVAPKRSSAVGSTSSVFSRLTITKKRT